MCCMKVQGLIEAFVFNQYKGFRRKVNDGEGEARKVVQMPTSQFKFGGNFADFEHQSESFRFVGESNMPYTRNGRNYAAGGEG